MKNKDQIEILKVNRGKILKIEDSPLKNQSDSYSTVSRRLRSSEVSGVSRNFLREGF